MGIGRTRHLSVGVAAAALVATALLTAVAQAAPGDIYVADEDALPTGGNNDGAIFKVGPAGAPVTPLVSGAPFLNPSGMVLNRDGNLLVADYGDNSSDSGAIYQVNPQTGARTVFASGPPFFRSTDLAFGPDGMLYVADEGPYATGVPQIIRLNPKTKAATVIATGSGDWKRIAGIAVARDGTIYFSDYTQTVFKRDPHSGTVTTLATDSVFLSGADGLLLSPDDRTLYVAAFAGNPNKVVRIDTRTGATSLVAGVTDTVALSLLPDGSLLSSNTAPSGSFSGTLERIVGSTVSSFSTDPQFSYPHDTVIEPQRCAGLIPTVVGTNGPDKLTGSRFADVISTLGGNDTVKGGGGKDVICGGPGKDKLLGQAGNDKLIGQGGKDTLVGGKGKDKLKCTPIDPRCKQ